MKGHGLLSVTALAIALTGYLLSTAASPAAPRREASRTVQTVSFSQDPAAQRWVRAEPHHWRDCMLKR